MKALRILFNAYPTNCKGGGAVVKIRKLASFLRDRGHSVEFFDPWSTNVEDFDVYHHFSMFPADLPMIRFVAAAGVPICIEAMYFASWTQVFSTIELTKSPRSSLNALKYAQRRWLPWLTRERAIINLASVVFVNSELEKRVLTRDFGVNASIAQVHYNGVDRSFAKADPALFANKYGLKDFALITGIVEHRKNHLNVIRALKGTNVHLVAIGPVPSVHKDYFEKCKFEADESVHFIDGMDHDDPLFRSAYAASKVLVMPSWQETTGKSHLEAAILGKNVVISTNAPAAREYLEDDAFYVRPNRLDEIRTSILKAVDAPSPQRLQQRVLREFCWDTLLGSREETYQSLVR